MTQRLFVETDYERPDGGSVAGRVLTLGWGVEPAGSEAVGEPVGTL